MGLETPSAPSVLSLTPPLETLWSVQWLVVRTHLCICQDLAESLRRQLYQAPVSMHFLASTIVSAFGEGIWDRAPGGAVSVWPLLQSLLHTFHRSKCRDKVWSSLFFLKSIHVVRMVLHFSHPFTRGWAFGLFQLLIVTRKFDYAHLNICFYVDICFHFSWVAS